MTSDMDYSELVMKLKAVQKEKEDIEKDLEIVCRQNGGAKGALEAMEKARDKRNTALEQELIDCQHKLATTTMDYADLQSDYTAALRYQEELLTTIKIEAERSTRALEDVKFYQSQAALALRERDQALGEAEALQERHQETDGDLEYLHERVEALERQLNAVEKDNKELIHEKKATEHIKISLEKFINAVWHEWKFNVSHASAEMDSVSKADIMWDKIQRISSSSRAEGSSQEAGFAQSQEFELELAARKVELQQEMDKRKKALENFHNLRHQELDCLKEEVKALVAMETKVQEEKFEKVLELATSKLQEAYNRIDAEQDNGVRVKEMLEDKLKKAHRLIFKMQQKEEWEPDGQAEGSNPPYNIDTRGDEDDECEEILAQATNEKVSALLLLSQQEERYQLERRSFAAMEERVDTLSTQLSRVTNEKIDALLQLAECQAQNSALQDGIRVLQEQSQRQKSSSLSSSMLSAYWSGGAPSNHNDPNNPGLPQPVGSAGKEPMRKQIVATSSRSMPSAVRPGAFIPAWLSLGPGSTGMLPAARKKHGGQLDEEMDFVARLKIENSGLLQSLENIDHCTQTASSMRIKLSRIQNDIDNAESKGLLLESKSRVDALVEEARRLKISHGGSELPVSWCEEGTKNPGDIATETCFEMIELILFCANLLQQSMTA